MKDYDIWYERDRSCKYHLEQTHNIGVIDAVRSVLLVGVNEHDLCTFLEKMNNEAWLEYLWFWFIPNAHSESS
jgi:hypothetical protein